MRKSIAIIGVIAILLINACQPSDEYNIDYPTKYDYEFTSFDEFGFYVAIENSESQGIAEGGSLLDIKNFFTNLDENTAIPFLFNSFEILNQDSIAIEYVNGTTESGLYLLNDSKLIVYEYTIDDGLEFFYNQEEESVYVPMIYQYVKMNSGFEISEILFRNENSLDSNLNSFISNRNLSAGDSIYLQYFNMIYK